MVTANRISSLVASPEREACATSGFSDDRTENDAGPTIVNSDSIIGRLSVERIVAIRRYSPSSGGRAEVA